MMPTQGNEIVEAGLAARGPVFDVVGIYPFTLRAPGEAATLVPDRKGMTDGAGDHP